MHTPYPTVRLPDTKHYTYLDVQGRQVRIVRIEDGAGGGDAAEGEPAPAGPTLALALSPEGTDSPVALTLEGARIDAVTEDDLRRFLAPFHIGPDR